VAEMHGRCLAYVVTIWDSWAVEAIACLRDAPSNPSPDG
jgi:hypothetical protein